MMRPGSRCPYVKTDDRFLRPADVDQLVGDASRARELLDWEPRTTFPDVLREMVDHDVKVEKDRAGI
jgi:GDPmannose 4,6-dehydratase